jgi:hypothetical protein
MNGKVRLTILLLSSLVLCRSQSTLYTDGSMQVEFVVVPIDGGYGSQKACVKLLEGFDRNTYDYTTACFSRTYNERSIFTQCEVAFDNATCNSCLACETNNNTVGYKLDCMNAQPSVNTDNQCETFTNESVQEILVGPTFSVSLNFSTPLPANETNGNSSTGNNSSGTSGGRCIADLPMNSILSILSSIVGVVYVGYLSSD